MEHRVLDLPDDPKLARNITHFARALRAAGVPAGPGRTIDAIRAVAAAGFTDRDDFYVALQACLCSRPEHRAVFGQLFRLYWRDPRYLDHMMGLLRPTVRGLADTRATQAAETRAAEALLAGAAPPPAPGAAEEEEAGSEIEVDARMTLSREERLKTLDFEQMSTAEAMAAKRLISRLSLPIRPIAGRRLRARPRGPRADWRRTLRASLKTGGEIDRVLRRDRQPRWPALVCLCDISGSMASYSRAALHFFHAAANAQRAGWSRVHAFTFGTRLTNITRHLRDRDVDAALAAAGAEAQDWEGGTRIGECIQAFNRDWSRRVLGQGAVVVLITDGLDRGDPAALAAAMQRLRLSARRVIWLNPLLRFDGFAARATGIRAMLPQVDSFRAGHNVAALEGLCEALGRPDDPGEIATLRRRLMQPD